MKIDYMHVLTVVLEEATFVVMVHNKRKTVAVPARFEGIDVRVILCY